MGGIVGSRWKTGEGVKEGVKAPRFQALLALLPTIVSYFSTPIDSFKAALPSFDVNTTRVAIS